MRGSGRRRADRRRPGARTPRPSACPARRSRCGPAARSGAIQTTVVSRWSLIPTAASARASAPDVTQRDPDAGPHALEDLLGIVLDPAGSRGDLGVLQLVAGDRPTRPVEQDAAAARRPLVDGGDERPRIHGRLVAVGAPVDRLASRRRPGSASTGRPHPGRGMPRSRPTPFRPSRPTRRSPCPDVSSLIWPRRMSTPFTTAAAPLNAEKTMTRTTGTPSTNVPTAKIAPTIRAMTITMKPVPRPSHSKNPIPRA